MLINESQSPEQHPLPSYWLFCARMWFAVCSTHLFVWVKQIWGTLAARRTIDCERNIVSIVVLPLPLLAVLCTAVVRRVAVVCFAFASGLANVSFTQFSLPLLCFRKRLRSKKCTFLLFSLARVEKK